MGNTGVGGLSRAKGDMENTAIVTAEASTTLGLGEQGDEVRVVSTPKFRTRGAAQLDQVPQELTGGARRAAGTPGGASESVRKWGVLLLA